METLTIYATREAVKEFEIVTTDMEVLEQIGSDTKDDLFIWGAHIFYFEDIEGIILVNKATRLTFFIFDIMSYGDIMSLGNYIIDYMRYIYRNNPEMEELVEKYDRDFSRLAFSKIKDRTLIANINHTLRFFTRGGEHFYKFCKDGVIREKEINETINFTWLVREKKDGEIYLKYPSEIFEEKMKERYKKV